MVIYTVQICDSFPQDIGFEDFDYLPEIPIEEVTTEPNSNESDDEYEDIYGEYDEDDDDDYNYEDEDEEEDDSYQFEVKIVGGSRSVPHKYPFAAVLTSPHYNGHFCGGTLITKRHVVTAAHCFQGKTM